MDFKTCESKGIPTCKYFSSCKKLSSISNPSIGAIDNDVEGHSKYCSKVSLVTGDNTRASKMQRSPNPIHQAKRKKWNGSNQPILYMDLILLSPTKPSGTSGWSILAYFILF